MGGGPVSQVPELVELRIPLRWADTDGLGHVWHGVHVSLIEEARTRWLDALRAPGTGLWDHAVVRIEVDYAGELRYADAAAVVTCRGTGFGTRSVRTHEHVRTPSGALVAEARSVVVAWEPAMHAARALTEHERALLAVRCAHAD